MKKFLSTTMLMMAMLVMLAMPVSATVNDGSNPSPLPDDEFMQSTEELPGDEFLEEAEKEGLPADEYMKSAKTADMGFSAYAIAMVAIAAAGTIVIAKKKEA